MGYYNSVAKRTNNDPKALANVMKSIQILGRDHSRLPMQWDASPYAGFTSNKDGAWIRTNDSYREINVASQINNPTSVLNFWKQMLSTRKQYKDLFIHGAFEEFDVENENTFVFGKTFGKDRALVVLNFTDKEQEFQRPDLGGKFELLVGNVEGSDGTESSLKGYEGRVYLVN
jgi:oligo-1,6-glucosidase